MRRGLCFHVIAVVPAMLVSATSLYATDAPATLADQPGESLQRASPPILQVRVDRPGHPLNKTQ